MIPEESSKSWRTYAKHTDTEIQGFFGPYRWLSNFYKAPCEYEGIVYPTSENAYQAAKVKPEFRGIFTECSAADSKLVWKQFSLVDEEPEDWDKRKEGVMAAILLFKFTYNTELLERLLSTKDRYLEETNHWGDIFWGVDYETREGKNTLGKILMKIRENKA
jgi:ribA/ribD-fused uncharacterized protein